MQSYGKGEWYYEKVEKDKKITYKMISVCLSLVMMITSFYQ